MGGSRISFLIIHFDVLFGFGCRVCFILVFLSGEKLFAVVSIEQILESGGDIRG